MEKVILFDWGGVVETSSIAYSTMRDIMYSLGFTNVDEDLIYSEFHSGVACSIFDEITDEKENDRVIKCFLEKLAGEVKVTDEVVDKYKKLYVEMMNNNPYYKEVSEYIYSLADDCEIGMLSNVQILDKERQNAHFNYDKVKYRFLSCELGMVKPNRDIYEYVANKLSGKEILFLDDNAKNLVVPMELGWKTYEVQKGGDLDGIRRVCEDFLGE